MTPDPEGPRPQDDEDIPLPAWRAAVIEKMLRMEREETCLLIADRLDEALAAKNPDEAVARCWDLVKELRDPEAAVGGAGAGAAGRN